MVLSGMLSIKTNRKCCLTDITLTFILNLNYGKIFVHTTAWQQFSISTNHWLDNSITRNLGENEMFNC